VRQDEGFLLPRHVQSGSMNSLQPAIDADTGSAQPRTSRARDIFELVLGYGMILAVIWTPNPPQRILYWITFALVIVITLLRRDSLRTLGLTRDGFLRSLWVVGAAAILAAIAVAVAWRLHTLHRHFGRISLDFHFSGYVIWALLQQFLLQDYFLLRLLRLVRNPWIAVAIAAAIFSIAHMPNPVLVILTLVWGLIACVLFLRYRNLYALGIAHAILGICVAISVPNHIQRHMRVGLGYLHYHPPVRRLHRPLG
jgi:membrane protease YdiL (CAAX protease family)